MNARVNRPLFFGSVAHSGRDSPFRGEPFVEQIQRSTAIVQVLVTTSPSKSRPQFVRPIERGEHRSPTNPDGARFVRSFGPPLAPPDHEAVIQAGSLVRRTGAEAATGPGSKGLPPAPEQPAPATSNRRHAIRTVRSMGARTHRACAPSGRVERHRSSGAAIGTDGLQLLGHPPAVCWSPFLPNGTGRNCTGWLVEGRQKCKTTFQSRTRVAGGRGELEPGRTGSGGGWVNKPPRIPADFRLTLRRFLALVAPSGRGHQSHV